MVCALGQEQISSAEEAAIAGESDGARHPLISKNGTEPALASTRGLLPMAPAGKSGAAPRKTLDAIRDATGASEDDISAMLAECNYDVNEATAKLIESEPGWRSPRARM